MASQILKRLYRDARAANVGCVVGEAALSAWWAARTLRRWQALESMGLVRLRAELDEGWEPGCSCEDPECLNKDPESEAFGAIGEYCLPYVDDEGFWEAEGREDSADGWHTGGSVWGHVGYKDVIGWRENAYILGIMAETIDAFRAAWKARQRRPGKRRESQAVA